MVSGAQKGDCARLATRSSAVGVGVHCEPHFQRSSSIAR
jgi:hypothetical protein